MAIQLEKKNSEIDKIKREFYTSGDKVTSAQTSLKNQQDMNAKCNLLEYVSIKSDPNHRSEE